MKNEELVNMDNEELIENIQDAAILGKRGSVYVKILLAKLNRADELEKHNPCEQHLNVKADNYCPICLVNKIDELESENKFFVKYIEQLTICRDHWKNSYEDLKQQVAKGDKAIAFVEKIRENIPIPVASKGWRCLLPTGYSIFEQIVINLFKEYDKE